MAVEEEGGDVPSCVNLENLFPPFEIGQTKLNLPIDSPRSEQRGIQRVRSVGRHDDSAEGLATRRGNRAAERT
jgi:hypothetical protein